jgi:hypothetical protein
MFWKRKKKKPLALATRPTPTSLFRLSWTERLFVLFAPRRVEKRLVRRIVRLIDEERNSGRYSSWITTKDIRDYYIRN